MTRTRARPIRRVFMPALAALGLAVLLGGCVVDPGYPGYGYGYGPGYYAPGYVAFGGGWGWHGGDWHGGGWHGGGWHR